MNILGIILFIVVILGLIGIISYFVYVYLQDADIIEGKITSANKKIKDEQSNRVSNIKYVVDQVNTVNKDIAKEVTDNNASLLKSLNIQNSAITTNRELHNKQYSGLNTSVTSIQSNVGKNSSNINNIVTGFGQYITFGGLTGTNGYNLLNLPSSPPADINLMSKVNLLMGMTAKNLSPVSGSNINFCYGPDTKYCSSFPNKNGDTVITAAPDKAINLMGTTRVYGNFGVSGNTYFDSTRIAKNLDVRGNTYISGNTYLGDIATNSVRLCSKDSVTTGTVNTAGYIETRKCNALTTDSNANLVIKPFNSIKKYNPVRKAYDYSMEYIKDDKTNVIINSKTQRNLV